MVNRVFRGGYHPSYERLQHKRYAVLTAFLSVYVQTSTDHGKGGLEGVIKLKGLPHPHCPVHVFNKSSLVKIWSTTSDLNGVYVFRNMAVGLECFVIAFDPNEEYNAVISDKVVAK